jgi:uncharacterized protein
VRILSRLYRAPKPVKLPCSDIPEGGLRVEFQGKDGRWNGLKGLAVKEPPCGFLLVQRQGLDVFVQGEVRATLWFECSRCLEGFQHTVEATIRQMLRPSGEARVEAREIELHPEDLEYGNYDGEDILLESIVEEHLLLSLPMRPLCREDCKGLCPGCGANRNQRECACAESARKSPFDCLKDFVVKEG